MPLSLSLSRSLIYKYVGVFAGSAFERWQLRSTVMPYIGTRGAPTETLAVENIKAAKSLLQHLQHGHTGQGIHRVPINGDTTRLPFAEGLTPLERKLAWAQHFLARHLAGTQQVRLCVCL